MKETCSTIWTTALALAAGVMLTVFCWLSNWSSSREITAEALLGVAFGTLALSALPLLSLFVMAYALTAAMKNMEKSKDEVDREEGKE
jgi:hypothetical protein